MRWNIPVLKIIAVLIGSGEAVKKLPDNVQTQEKPAVKADNVIETVKSKLAETAKKVHYPSKNRGK